MAKKTPVVPLSNLRVRVRARSGKPIEQADVSIDSPATSLKTGADGFVKLGLTPDQINALSPAGKLTIHAKKRHHGPDPGAGGTITPGEVQVTATVTTNGFDPSTAGLSKDGRGPFLDLVLMDAGLNFGVATPGTPTRRLTNTEVQNELLFLVRNDDIALSAASEPDFTHDPASGEFAACDPTKCTFKAPAITKRVSFQQPVIAKVKFFLLTNFAPSAAAKADKIPGQRFTRDKFSWNNMPLSLVDQRHVVGLARLCKSLAANQGVAAIFTQGISGDSTRPDTHGFGQAIDFGGCSTALPDPADKNPPIRLGTDFIVLLHWGNFPMWDPVTVHAAPTDPTKWKRLRVNDDGRDYSTDPNGNTVRLHYRLDPAPFQDAVPADVDAATAAKLALVGPHFVATRAMFQAVYDFATSEYTDGNSTLGPLPASASPDVPTPIDSHKGHFILHPDYPSPNAPGDKNGRQAHVNHFHFQVGPTNFPAPRTT